MSIIHTLSRRPFAKAALAAAAAAALAGGLYGAQTASAGGSDEPKEVTVRAVTPSEASPGVELAPVRAASDGSDERPAR